jgi:lipopolysaccharide/colanic/teichoic acid biosynthesis glycosyltransferase
MERDALMPEPTIDLAIPRANPAGRHYHRLKRVLDLVLAGVGTSLLFPVLGVIAAVIRATSRGPAVYRQTRIGQYGQPFTVYKFRTMYVDADSGPHQAYVEAYVRGQVDVPPHAESDAAPFKLSQDPRITPVGRWLRRTSLDELPQLFNVLKGEMSLVGPRPDVPYSVALYKDWHKLRLAALPGLTGLWQVRGRGRVSFDEMMRLDCEYVQTQSLWLDCVILANTIPAVLSMKGAA